ncbi:hypothetical protein [Prescottella agglutinans]|uniref:Uncharacterized protein n=1 Tax=Prescottella agglutinans TaxID=1644129 RepID=A0ABT6MJR2_9NOCA|nr:hypothetical protein [Prescottella agglutinans]MDH6284046.1 hypothetical protein [Prescottella agglutinans]
MIEPTESSTSNGVEPRSRFYVLTGIAVTALILIGAVWDHDRRWPALAAAVALWAIGAGIFWYLDRHRDQPEAQSRKVLRWVAILVIVAVVVLALWSYPAGWWSSRYLGF